MSEFEKNLWVEKYRPRNIDECILPDRLKADLKALVKDGEIPSMMFAGSAGSGKTSVAKAICNELDADYMLINGSEESGIDMLRTKVKGFASTVSLESEAKHKVIILDEADYLNPSSTQPALRGLMEEFSSNCRFIFTCNFKNRIISPLHSRCTVIDFSFTKEEKQRMMAGFFTRVLGILAENNVTVDKQVLAEFIKGKFPDFRSILNELQRYTSQGALDAGILRTASEEAVKEIQSFLRTKDFKAMRQWVDANDSLDIPTLFDKLYDRLGEVIEPKSVPELILILDDYQAKAPLVVNQRINMAACMTTLMAALQFKA